MVGSVSEAEDIVQEVFLRFHSETREGASIESPKAWLSTVTTRLSINHLRSARVRRERYVGTWLPEPVLTDPVPDASRHAETADSLSMAFLVLLESLSPVERAVFLLREVFEYDYGEIASVIGKSEDNCRQIAVRARRQVEAKKPRFEASRARRDELARRFFEAIGKGDTQGLIRLLAADVVAYADGGGKAAAFPRPVHWGRAGRAAALRAGGSGRASGCQRHTDRGDQRAPRCDVPRCRWASGLGRLARHRRRARADGARDQQSEEAAPPGPEAAGVPWQLDHRS
jgi:RNA polymerase sigma-70 factor (ECF subfamily)